jgi:predicted LPLAT superfamily acyltransferase
MSRWKGKTKGGVAGYKVFIFLIKNFGIKSAYLLLNFVAFYFFLFAKTEKAPIYWYFRNIHKYKKFKAKLSVLKNFHLLGQSIIDKVAILSGNKQLFTFNFDGEEYLRQIAKEGKGGILIGAHTGNWEIAGQLLERIDTKIHIVMLEAEHEKIKHLLDNVLINRDMNIIPISNDFSHMFKIAEVLSNNEIIVVHGDRFMPGSKSINLKFLNYNANFPTGIFYLAVKQQKPVVFVSALKETSTHYHFFATKPKIYAIDANIKNRNSLVAEIATDYIKNIETIIKKYPLQWFNYYYFWDTKTAEKI